MTDHVAARLRAYAREVLRFRRALNLTALEREDALFSRMIAPSVSLQRWIPQGATLLDIGSGMGVPGIPLLIVRDDLHGVLVERRRRRAEFLRHVVRTLRLDGEVFCGDAADMALPGRADVVVARAVADPATLLRLARPLIAPGGGAILPASPDAEAKEVVGWCVEEDSWLQFGHGVRQRVLRFRRQDERCFT